MRTNERWEELGISPRMGFYQPALPAFSCTFWNGMASMVTGHPSTVFIGAARWLLC